MMPEKKVHVSDGAIHLSLSGAVAVALSGLLAIPVSKAQSADNARAPSLTALEEIVVTATRRPTGLQQTPVAVSVLTEEAMVRGHVETFDNVFNLAPNAFIYSNGGNKQQTFPLIRGSYSANDSPGADQPLAFFIDDLYYGSVASFGAEFFDVNRIELLRGPQGTTFGRNVTGGALVVVNNPPEFDNHGSLALTARNYNGYELQGVANGVLVDDRLAARLAVSTRNVDGYSRNTRSGNELQGADVVSARGSIRWAPTSSIDGVLTGWYTRDRSPGLDSQWIFTGDGASRFPELSTEPDTTNQADTGYERDMWSGSAAVDVTFNAGTLTSISGVRGMDTFATVDAVPLLNPATNTSVLVNRISQDERQYSQELRFTSTQNERVEWIAGLFGLKQEAFREEAYDYAPVAGTSANPAGTVPSRFNAVSQDVDVTSLAVFGEALVHLTDWFGVRLGGRYTQEEKEGRSIIRGTGPTSLNRVIPVDVTYGDEWDSFSPRVNLEFTPTDSLFFYLSYSEGFRSGAYSFVASAPAAASPAVQRAAVESQLTTALRPEEVVNYEVGARTSWFDNRLTFNVTGFSTTTDDLQFQRFDAATLTFPTGNVGELKAEGFEIEASALVTEALTLSAAYGYTDAVYEDFDACGIRVLPGIPPTVVTLDCDGQSVTGVPEDTLTIAGSYRLAIGDAGAVTLATDVRYMSELPKVNNITAGAPVPQNVLDRAKIEGLLNASATWESASGNLSVQVWGKNLTDERYIGSPVNLSPFALTPAEAAAGESAISVGYNPPRSYGVTVRMKFR